MDQRRWSGGDRQLRGAAAPCIGHPVQRRIAALSHQTSGGFLITDHEAADGLMTT